MSNLPLKGIRVIDMGRIYAGPTTCKILGDMGADVIKLESIQRLDLPNRKLCYPENDPDGDSYNRGGWFHWLNSNKRSITLDLNNAKGVGVFKKLVAVSDVVLENFSPRVMKNFGLDYEVLKAIRPDLIMVSLSGYGDSGPYRDRPAYAWAFEGIAGFQSVTGFSGGQPMIVGTGYGDWSLGVNGACAVMLALLHRRKTGEGQYVNVAGQETVLHHIGEDVLGYHMNGVVPQRVGNRHDSEALQGCYRCKGDDQWITITINDDEEWSGFCQAVGDSSWASDKRFSSVMGRRRHHDELDALIETWTKQVDHYEAMRVLQTVGVPAAAVLSPKEVLFDEQFRKRSFFSLIDQPGAGKRPMPKLAAAQFSDLESPVRPAPLLGEHNREVLQGLLGLTDEEFEDLEKDKVIGNVPVGHGEIRDRGFNIPFVTRIGSASHEPDYLEQVKAIYGAPGKAGSRGQPEKGGFGLENSA